MKWRQRRRGEREREREIEKLKEYSAPGPDNIPPIVIKELKEELNMPLTILFQKSMETGRIPDDWREANVTPLFKRGKKI